MKEGLDVVLNFQRNEITEAQVYGFLSKLAKGKNKEILNRIRNDELKHYQMWREISGQDVNINWLKVFYYSLLALIFGVTFTIKLMEKGEESAELAYKGIASQYTQAEAIYKDEEKHEETLYKLIEEEKLSYLGSIVLGLNDALVEITGTLAGLSFALRVSQTVGIAGLITGVAASLSMAASEYLSQVADGKPNPMKAAIYTLIAYFVVVLALVLPYFFIGDAVTAFVFTVGIGLLVVVYYAGFASVIHEKSFEGTFLQMLLVVFGVSLISFGIGELARRVFGISV
ncbi:membrane protein [Coprothermobacter proteolyticus DSM 5265]|uniref:Integral membrane protein n=1 Tax=Coprothermobacter proteolyticus (strain ATCC 35245 / DSM 5265 / OCM 4 / BT) TaxID=309798 RepID=B5Y9G4_COPPD|nr:VIT1/CCC1 family protein [Coprothermobacter proteolyticus]ACI17759.1 membrane protein [Coprothermobacter proteolyticus DSM 5265]